MAMSYLKIYYDWPENTRTLSLEEKGRLIDALVYYARGDPEMSELTGNEQFLFPLYKRQIDRNVAYYACKCSSHAGALLKEKEEQEEQEQHEEHEEQEQHEQQEEHEQHEQQEPSFLKKTNENWRSSIRARRAVAQLIVDEIRKRNLPCACASNLFDLVEQAMLDSLEPQEIWFCACSAGKTDLGLWIYEMLLERGRTPT